MNVQGVSVDLRKKNASHELNTAQAQPIDDLI
jgi:hypothetical protein